MGGHNSVHHKGKGALPSEGQVILSVNLLTVTLSM
jgi:hypothetical protein